jgi:GNAT superfamily N-acetyltransferase
MIRPLDLDDDAALERAYQIKVACEVGEPHEGLHRFRSSLRHLPAGDRGWCWSAGADGFALLWIGDASPDARTWIFVDPARRHRGVGQALLHEVLDAARAAGCRTVRARYADGDGDAASFADATGAAQGYVNLRGLLLMPAHPVNVAVDGFALRSWTDRTPDDLLDTMAEVREAINDAPGTPGIAPDRYTPARVRVLEETVLRRGVQTRLTAALDRAGRIVGFTELRVGPEPGALATTEDTAVLAEHRGRGLATWIKVESLRLLRADRPDVDRVVTDNAETNAAMLAVNARLGFRTVSRWLQAVLPVR